MIKNLNFYDICHEHLSYYSIYSFEKLIEQIEENSCILIGGFQKGHFSKETEKIIEQSFSIHDSSLEAHLVASRLVYEYEKTIFI